jgi:hypothetical protein
LSKRFPSNSTRYIASAHFSVFIFIKNSQFRHHGKANKRPSVEKSAASAAGMHPKSIPWSLTGVISLVEVLARLEDPEFIDICRNGLPDGLSLLNFVNVKAAKLYESVAVLDMPIISC